MTATWRILHGDARDQLATLPERSVQTCVTSPPYFGLRDYGTGKWDGGDPDCDHSAAPTRTVGNAPSAKSTLTTNNGAGPRPGDKFHADQRREVADACPCGATRTDSQIGLEPTVDEYVTALVDVFRAVRRVLRDDGTVWLNLGDSYAGGGPSGASYQSATTKRRAEGNGQDGAFRVSKRLAERGLTYAEKKPVPPPGVKAKDLIGVPWRVAFALQADGWYLRSEIIWAKPNPMPESVTDRPTRAHEQVFLLAKQPRYFWDADAIREQSDPEQAAHNLRYAREYEAHTANVANGSSQPGNVGNVGLHARQPTDGRRNKRSVWTIATTPYAGAHFATFPPKLIEPCILAGSPERACGECGAPWVRVTERTTVRERAQMREGPKTGALVGSVPGYRNALSSANSHDGASSPEVRTVGFEPSCDHNDPTGQAIVLDPFAGSGTTGVVALRHNRSFIGVELNASYVELTRRRICDDAPLFNTHAET